MCGKNAENNTGHYPWDQYGVGSGTAGFGLFGAVGCDNFAADRRRDRFLSHAEDIGADTSTLWAD